MSTIREDCACAWPDVRRSPLIAGAFYRRGLIEQWGRGTQKIVDWCVATGQPEPEFEEQAGAVVVRFRPSGYKIRMNSAE